MAHGQEPAQKGEDGGESQHSPLHRHHGCSTHGSPRLHKRTERKRERAGVWTHAAQASKDARFRRYEAVQPVPLQLLTCQGPPDLGPCTKLPQGRQRPKGLRTPQGLDYVARVCMCTQVTHAVQSAAHTATNVSNRVGYCLSLAGVWQPQTPLSGTHLAAESPASAG